MIVTVALHLDTLKQVPQGADLEAVLVDWYRAAIASASCR